MSEKITGIYMIKNLKNGKVYIGQSVDVRSRWYAHKNDLRKKSHKNIKLQNAWNKYGEENFSFEVILTCPKEELNYNEKYYVTKYNSYKEGYNMTLGGNDNTSYPKEFGEKISHTRNNFSKEKKEEIRKKNLAVHMEECIPIYQLDLDGKVLKLWQSTRFAAYTLGINQSCIQSCLNLKRRTYKNSIWIREKDFESFDINNYRKCGTQPRRVKQINNDGEVVKIWESANSASKEGFDSSAIIKCCKGVYNTHKGYKWEYAD